MDLEMREHFLIASLMAVMALTARSEAGPDSDMSAVSAPAAVSDFALDLSADASGTSADANDSAAVAASPAPASGARE